MNSITAYKTKETSEKYLKTVERRRRKLASIKEAKPELITADELIDDLQKRVEEIKQNTIRFNRAALAEWITCQEHICESEKARLLERIDPSRHEIISQRKSKRRLIPRGIKLPDWLKINRQIESGLVDSLGEEIAGEILRATLKTGLRPAEWRHASLAAIHVEELLEKGFDWPNHLENVDPNGLIPVVFVWNAKHTNGRGRDGYRYIPIPQEPELASSIEMISQDIENYLSEGNSFESWLNRLDRGCAKLMKKTFPRRKKHYTIYNSRHQFSAELKAKNLPHDVVAELMGHSSHETASIHYARKRSGWGTDTLFKQNKPNKSMFIPKPRNEGKGDNLDSPHLYTQPTEK